MACEGAAAAGAAGSERRAAGSWVVLSEATAGDFNGGNAGADHPGGSAPGSDWELVEAPRTPPPPYPDTSPSAPLPPPPPPPPPQPPPPSSPGCALFVGARCERARPRSCGALLLTLILIIDAHRKRKHSAAALVAGGALGVALLAVLLAAAPRGCSGRGAAALDLCRTPVDCDRRAPAAAHGVWGWSDGGYYVSA